MGWVAIGLIGSVCFTQELQSNQADGVFFASGVKVGEVDQYSAIVWLRTTRERSADFSRLAIFTEGLIGKAKDQIAMPSNVVTGMAAEVRVRYWMEGAEEYVESEWASTRVEKNYCHQFRLSGLRPGTAYGYEVVARRIGSAEVGSKMSGAFRTAPAVDSKVPIRFVVSTCQAVRSVDSGAEGHRAYQTMLEFEPDFMVHTGDIVYYDKAPLCRNRKQAEAKWDLMFAYGFNQKFHRSVASYFMKDDHDTLKNDCWPGQSYGELTFAQGLEIFRQQVPMGEKTYRTIRWGKDVQIWLTENRDFRSSNRMADGAEKTILGKEQLRWLMDGLRSSTATHKFVISPGPIVGPDKKGKADNHANAAFAHEGQLLRDFLSEQANTYVICGDRHWQYCSTDPKTGLTELGCGPINDEHKFGGNPGHNPGFHSYFHGGGGFLAISVADGVATASWYPADGLEPRHKMRLE